MRVVLQRVRQGSVTVNSEIVAHKGRRPSFVEAARPEIAEPLVSHYADQLRAEGITRVERGLFGAMMQIEIHNDGPVTIILDTDDL
jgi:D-tyrosyl-tRNA(Tyr) deacylase